MDILTYTLPLTTSTGKARVKRRKDNFGEPISVTGNNKFEDEDYIEWQISYFVALDSIWDSIRKSPTLKDKLDYFDETFHSFKSKELISELKQFIQNNESIRKRDFKNGIKEIFNKNNEIVINKPHKGNKEYVMFELADLFRMALKQVIISKKEVEDLLKFNKDKEKIDIETQFKVKRSKQNKKISDNFDCWTEDYPVFIKDIDSKSFVEAQLKHKQKAVGYQSMIYFCIWLKEIKDKSGNSVIGRSANSNELVNINITKEEIIEIAKIFMIASQDHNKDIKIILKELIKS